MKKLISIILLLSSVQGFSQIYTYTSGDTASKSPDIISQIKGSVKTIFVWDQVGLKNGSAMNLIEIPTGDVELNPRLSANAYQSRIIIDNKVRVEEDYLDVYIEGDFHGAGNGGFRLRHAYLAYKGWLIGHSWSAASDGDSWVTIADFDGPTTGAWVRQPTIRYTGALSKGWTWTGALEAPFNDLSRLNEIDTTFRGAEPRYPDLLFNVRHNYSKGHVQLAAIGRYLYYRKNNDVRTTFGAGLVLTGTHRLTPKDLITYQLVAGSGIERYMVSFGGRGLDALPSRDSKELETLPIIGGYLGYKHHWHQKLFSSFVAGYCSVRLPESYNPQSIFRGIYASTNLFWNPVPKLTIGPEVVFGDHLDFEGNYGKNWRIYFMAEYFF